MKQKNLSVKNKNKRTLTYLNDKKILKIFKNFSNSLGIDIKGNLAVAVSGGPDSLALAFLTKCYALYNKKLKIKYFIVDHKLRKESSLEVKAVKKILNKIAIKCKVLNWNGKKPSKNIQAIARNKRYHLLTNECKKNKIKYLLLGHHLNDLFENFLIRLVRGSGLNGLISFNKKTKYKDQDIKILRPLLDVEKKDLINISKEVFDFYVKDPSNNNEDYKRTRIRNFLNFLEKEGLDRKKLKLTISNLKDSDSSIKLYVHRNLEKNSILKKKVYILNFNFFKESHEVVFRSLTKIIQKIGKKYYPVRGKSVDELIKRIDENSLVKVTLGGCLIQRVNKTILISKESSHKI